jgi:hypothetical protein
VTWDCYAIPNLGLTYLDQNLHSQNFHCRHPTWQSFLLDASTRDFVHCTSTDGWSPRSDEMGGLHMWHLSSSLSSSSVLFVATVSRQVRQMELKVPSGLRLWGKKGTDGDVNTGALAAVIRRTNHFRLRRSFGEVARRTAEPLLSDRSAASGVAGRPQPFIRSFRL